ncbi:hypothetical protein R3P38DRAFT_1658348 [Favolaschia claudopus]|uniref:Uncharacterized protein n=1 Tax=Favolaschia claudopus TaxID=2862362 RepID=A0AAW0AF01_9AGAR
MCHPYLYSALSYSSILIPFLPSTTIFTRHSIPIILRLTACALTDAVDEIGCDAGEVEGEGLAVGELYWKEAQQPPYWAESPLAGMRTSSPQLACRVRSWKDAPIQSLPSTLAPPWSQIICLAWVEMAVRKKRDRVVDVSREKEGMVLVCVASLNARSREKAGPMVLADPGKYSGVLTLQLSPHITESLRAQPPKTLLQFCFSLRHSSMKWTQVRC